jgi:hypothetical protein
VVRPGEAAPSGCEVECLGRAAIRRWPTARNAAAPIPDATDVQISAASPAAHPNARVAAEPAVSSMDVPIGTLAGFRPMSARKLVEGARDRSLAPVVLLEA